MTHLNHCLVKHIINMAGVSLKVRVKYVFDPYKYVNFLF